MTVAAQVTLAVVGAGPRGRMYASFAARSGERARVVAVADPRAAPRRAVADRCQVPAGRQFGDWREMARLPRLADAVVIAAPDREHADAAREFASLGYHVLLEKPMATTAGDCASVVAAAQSSGAIFAVCHVLRYTPYTRAVRRVIDSGELGELIGIQHAEPVGWWHFAHSYVRGSWHSAAESGPSILTKCCHDLDWLRYLVGTPAVRIASVGGLRHFTPAHRPPDAGERCTDCAAEPGCPYSAVRLYLRMLADPEWRRYGTLAALIPGQAQWDEPGVLAALREGPYGRCVYSGENDVADHQVVTIEFAGGTVATLTMSAFTPGARRLTRIMGSHGYLDGDGITLSITDFTSGQARRISARPEAPSGPPGGFTGDDVAGGHDGGDDAVISAFIHAVATGDTAAIRSTPAESLESHLMAFAAEQSRHAGGHPIGMPGSETAPGPSR